MYKETSPPIIPQAPLRRSIPSLFRDRLYLFGEQRHLLVPERDASAIADRLQRYADDPDTLVSDGAALRRQIRSFDVRQCAARLSDLYDAIR